jgi:hypothetical protein
VPLEVLTEEGGPHPGPYRRPAAGVLCDRGPASGGRVPPGEGDDGKTAAQKNLLSPRRGERQGEGGDLSLRLLSLKSPPDAALAIAGTVRVAAGPWSLEEGWWTDSGADRDYWDVELSDGGLYRIYRARNGGEWFADGVYD